MKLIALCEYNYRYYQQVYTFFRWKCEHLDDYSCRLWMCGWLLTTRIHCTRYLQTSVTLYQASPGLHVSNSWATCLDTTIQQYKYITSELVTSPSLTSVWPQQHKAAHTQLLICFISRLNHSYWEICKCLVSNSTTMSYFQAQVVGPVLFCFIQMLFHC